MFIFPARISIKQISTDFKNYLKKKYLIENSEIESEILEKTLSDFDSIIKYFNIVVESEVLFDCEKENYHESLEEYEKSNEKILKLIKKEESTELKTDEQMNDIKTEILDETKIKVDSVEYLLKTSLSNNDLMKNFQQISPNESIESVLEVVAVIEDSEKKRTTRNKAQKKLSTIKERKKTVKPKEMINREFCSL